MAGCPLLSGLLRCLCSTVVMSLVIYNIMTESSCLSRNATGIQDADVCMLIRLTFWTDYYILIYTNHFMGRSRQLIVAIHDDHDGLTLLWVTHKVMNSLTLCSFSFGLAGTDIMVTFEVLLLSFLCKLIDIYDGWCAYQGGELGVACLVTGLLCWLNHGCGMGEFS